MPALGVSEKPKSRDRTKASARTLLYLGSFLFGIGASIIEFMRYIRCDIISYNIEGLRRGAILKHSDLYNG